MHQRSKLEKQYYSIYTESKKTLRNQEETKRLITSHKLARSILSRYSKDQNASSIIPGFQPVIHFSLDDGDNDSITSSLRQLGFESASLDSIRNLRTKSYLKSIECESVDSILLKMQPIQESPEEKKEDRTDEDKTRISTEILSEGSEPIKKFSCKNFCMKKISLKKIKAYIDLLKPIDLQSRYYLAWLCLVSVAYIYNLITITMRYAFEYDKGYGPEFSNKSEVLDREEYFFNETNWTNETILFSFENFFEMDKKRLWFIGDYISDIIYLIDMLLVQTRIKFIREGLWVKDIKSTSKEYFRSKKFMVRFLNLKLES